MVKVFHILHHSLDSIGSTCNITNTVNWKSAYSLNQSNHPSFVHIPAYICRSGNLIRHLKSSQNQIKLFKAIGIGYNREISFNLIWFIVCQKDKDSIIYIHGAFSLNSFIISLLCILIKKKYVLNSHGEIPLTLSRKLPRSLVKIIDLIIKTMLDNSHFYVGLNNTVLKYCKQLSDNNRVYFRPLPLDSTFIQKSLKLYNENHSKLDQQKHMLIGYVGRLSNEKNISLLLNSLPAYSKLLVAGTGPEESKLKSLAKNKHLPVTFLGFVQPSDLIQKIYKHIDILCLPSRTEGFPQVVVEALACGIPICITKLGYANYLPQSKSIYICEESELLNNLQIAIHDRTHTNISNDLQFVRTWIEMMFAPSNYSEFIHNLLIN